MDELLLPTTQISVGAVGDCGEYVAVAFARGTPAGEHLATKLGPRPLNHPRLCEQPLPVHGHPDVTIPLGSLPFDRGERVAPRAVGAGGRACGRAANVDIVLGALAVHDQLPPL